MYFLRLINSREITLCSSIGEICASDLKIAMISLVYVIYVIVYVFYRISKIQKKINETEKIKEPSLKTTLILWQYF